MCHGCVNKYIVSQSTIKYPYDNFVLNDKINTNGYYICNDSVFDERHYWFCRDGNMYIDNYRAYYGDFTGDYGLYEIKNDTIIANTYSVDEFWSWMIDYSVYRFEIIDKTTLRLIDITFKHKKGDSRSLYIGSVYKFRETGKEPVAKDFLLKKKWMWKDKDEWKKWKKEWKKKADWRKWQKKGRGIKQRQAK